MSEKSPQPDQPDTSREDKKSDKRKSPKASAETSDQKEAVKPKKKAAKKSAKKAVKKTANKKDQSTDVAGAGKGEQPVEQKPASDESGNRHQVRRGRVRGRGAQQQESGVETQVKLDDQLVAKRAWKIFLGEVNEEGLALIADKDARELARRSLRVAEIYSREEAISLKKRKEQPKKPEAKSTTESKEVKVKRVSNKKAQEKEKSD